MGPENRLPRRLRVGQHGVHAPADATEEFRGVVGVGHHVAEEVLETAHVPRDLEGQVEPAEDRVAPAVDLDALRVDIRTFESYTRNTMDISAIPVVKKLSHLPMLADPSHGTGRRDKVLPMARAAVAAGADGLLIEVHHDPDHALSDGAQSLKPDQFTELMRQLRIIAPAVGRTI